MEEQKPVIENQVLISRITHEGKKPGDGLFRINNFVIFVQKCKKGKTYEIEITSVYEKYAFAKVLREIKDTNEALDAINKED